MPRGNKGAPAAAAATECSAAPPIDELLRVPLPVRRRRLRPKAGAAAAATAAFGIRVPSSSPATLASAAADAGEEAASLLVHCGDGVVDTVVYTCGGRHQSPRGQARRHAELGT
eukprot:Rhum_TRINITY_DN14894_c9_g1::Rhum_TRINITY_DN14894_c9_g1_i1::g.126048::m.126048